jgi:hypothetical protein
MGRFECFAHPKPDIRPGSQFFNTPDYQRNLQMATGQRDFVDGVSTVNTYTNNYYIETYKPFIHIKVHTHG